MKGASTLRPESRTPLSVATNSKISSPLGNMPHHRLNLKDPISATYKGARSMFKDELDFASGFGLGAFDFGKGVYNIVRHPLQTTSGLITVAKHIPYLDLNSADDQEDLQFSKVFLHQIAKPYQESLAAGKPMQAIGRGTFEALALFFIPIKAPEVKLLGTTNKLPQIIYRDLCQVQERIVNSTQEQLLKEIADTTKSGKNVMGLYQISHGKGEDYLYRVKDVSAFDIFLIKGKVKVYIPDTAEKLEILDKVKNMITSVPAPYQDVFKQVIISPGPYPECVIDNYYYRIGAQASSDKSITFWGEYNLDPNIFHHEVAHQIDMKVHLTHLNKNNLDEFGNIINSPEVERHINSRWQEAMQNEKFKTVSDYGDISPIEDFAESYAKYVEDPLVFRAQFPDRSKIIDDIVKVNKRAIYAKLAKEISKLGSSQMATFVALARSIPNLNNIPK